MRDFDPQTLDAWITREPDFEPIEVGVGEWENNEDGVQDVLPFDDSHCATCQRSIGNYIGRSQNNPDHDTVKWEAPWWCSDEQYRCEDCAFPEKVTLDDVAERVPR